MTLQQEIDKRILLLTKASDNPEFQAFELECCRTDIVYRYKNYVWTDTNTSLFYWQPSSIPFIPFDFQIECIEEIRASITDGTKPPSERTELTNVFIEKSRQMGLSWLIMGVFAYWFTFHNHKYHCISQKEEDVDKTGNIRSLMEKVRFVLNNLPIWMIPAWYKRKIGTDHNKHLVISATWMTGSITGESANPNASRSGTYNAVFMDEMAFMSNAQAINTAASSATPTRIFNSTPNGEGNEFYRMRKSTQWRKDDDGNDVEPTVKGLRYHWSDHPLYDVARYNERIKGMSSEKIAQELEIDYNTALMWRVYNDFPTSSSVVIYNPLLPIYVWMDNSHWWTDPHSVIIAQVDDVHYINVIDSIEMNCSVTDMAEYLSLSPKWWLSTLEMKFLERYKKYNPKKAIYVSDPYDTHSTLNRSTIYEEYRKVNIHLNIPSERRKKEQIMISRSNMYKIRYNENCLDFASALMNARYPEVKEWSSNTKPKELPIHDRTSHFRSALEYWLVHLSENPVIRKKRVAEDTRVTRKATWKLRQTSYSTRRSASWKLISN